MHLSLCLPLPQPCATFPMAPPDLPITALIVMFTQLSLSSCWNVQDSLQTEPPDPVDQLRGCGWVQAEHTLTHALIWGVFGTQKEHLLWQGTSVPKRQKQMIFKWQVWKGFWLKDKQNKTHLNRAWPLNSLMWWLPQLIPTAGPQKIPESRTAHFAALQYQQNDIQSHLRLCSQNSDKDYTEQKEFPFGGQQANPLLQMEWPSWLWLQQYKTVTFLHSGFQTNIIHYPQADL